jgi:putative CocE/NonD family hydrolase
LSGRKDVVSYVSDAFANDRTFAGPIEADLWVTTTGTDGDFIVKVVDVWPSDSTATSPRGGSMAGYEQLVRWEVLRGKFRNNLSKPQPFKPGEPTRVRFKLNDLLHTVKAGHRLKVIVQSSMFPLIDRNPNKFINIPTADDADFQKAMVEILRTKRHRTKFTFGELLD